MRSANVLMAFVAPFAVVPFGIVGAADAPAAPGYTVLHDDFSQLREDFNRAKGSVRLLFVVDRRMAPAAQLLENPYVRNYWNASGEFGRALAKTVQLKNDEETVCAWDVWLLYGPEVEWTDSTIPQPELLMHQLWKLEGTKFPKLDSAIFAREVHSRLQALTASSVTSK